MGEHTLLRTMTRKSLMKFGKYADYTVDQVIGLNKKYYLRWVYYNCENISFTFDVLELLNIDNMQIDKPGKDSRTGIAVQEYITKFTPLKVKSHNMKRDRLISKSNLAIINKDIRNTKRYMQSKNHGR